MPFYRFFFFGGGEGSPTKPDSEKGWYPYSTLSGGPSVHLPGMPAICTRSVGSLLKVFRDPIPPSSFPGPLQGPVPGLRMQIRFGGNTRRFFFFFFFPRRACWACCYEFLLASPSDQGCAVQAETKPDAQKKVLRTQVQKVVGSCGQNPTSVSSCVIIHPSIIAYGFSQSRTNFLSSWTLVTSGFGPFSVLNQEVWRLFVGPSGVYTSFRVVCLGVPPLPHSGLDVSG